MLWRRRSVISRTEPGHQYHLNGVFYGMRFQIPAMLQAGAEHCAIVNMGSIHSAVANIGMGSIPRPSMVIGLTRNAAAEYGPKGLRINQGRAISIRRR